MSNYTREQADAIQAQIDSDLAKLEAGTHHVVDGQLVEK